MPDIKSISETLKLCQVLPDRNSSSDSKYLINLEFPCSFPPLRIYPTDANSCVHAFGCNIKIKSIKYADNNQDDDDDKITKLKCKEFRETLHTHEFPTSETKPVLLL